MKQAIWIALGFGMSLEMSTRLISSDNLIELVLLFDAAQLQDSEDRGRAAGFGRDLVDNLPPRVGVQVFRFGDRPDLASLPFDSFAEESLGGDTSSPSRMSLQQALEAAGERLCQPTKSEDATGKAIVLVGGSEDNERLTFSGSCALTVYTVSANSESDLPLRELAERTHGQYYSLATARGYTVAKDIQRQALKTAAEEEQHHVDSEAPKTPNRRRELHAFLSVSVLLAFWVWYRRFWRTRHPWKMPSEPPQISLEIPAYEANLKICSSRSSGSIFPISSRGLLILGGKQHGSTSLAQLLLPDPLVADEHCRIYVEAGTFFVADLGSGLGTFVNCEKVLDPTPLSPGDVLQVGETEFEFS